jgi:hypothetical protein
MADESAPVHWRYSPARADNARYPMRGGNPLIQFSQQLVSGFSTPQNVEAGGS